MFSRQNRFLLLLTVCFMQTYCYSSVKILEIINYNRPQYVADRWSNESFFENASRSRRSVFLLKHNASDKIVFQSKEKPATNKSQPMQRPRFYLPRRTYLPMDPKAYRCEMRISTDCESKTAGFRNRVLDEFLKSARTIVSEPNIYNIDYKESGHVVWEPHHRRIAIESKETVTTCMVVKAKVRILRKRDPPFSSLPLGKLFPKRKIFKMLTPIRSCAIVSSAGSMKNASLGRFIDLHDIVMRFNNAPVEGFEEDVGTKTTIRVVNSQVVSKSEFNFVEAKIFQNITIAAWDPGRYNMTLRDWLKNADFNLFANYEKFRKRYPKSNAYLVDPQSIWRLWDQLRSFSGTPIRKNPPSSGFIGLALLLPHCPYVDFIEYIPSTRLNGRCHYYSEEINSACTFGAWHPLAAEKLMTLAMNIADDHAVFQNGIVRIRRPDSKSCS